MKVTAVRAVALSAPYARPIMDAVHYIPARNALLVLVDTDAGLTGIGEAAAFGAPLCVARVVVEQELAPWIVGEDPLQIERLWQRMYQRAHQHGRRGLVVAGISGLDVALWDLLGKAHGVPLWCLLGAYRDRVPAYASGGFYAPGKGPEALAEEMAGYARRGFRYMKMKVGRNPEVPMNILREMPEPNLAAVTLDEDIRRVEAVRKAVGRDVKIMVDANNAWTAAVATQMARAFEGPGVYWFEEPVPTDDVAGSAEVAAHTPIPVAGYETEQTVYGFRELIARRAVDIVQPDVIWSGGITECRRIAALAYAHGLPCIPHNFSSAVSLAANLHFIASIPNGHLLEFDQNPNPLRDELLAERFEADAQGTVHVPDQPGLGIDLHPDTLERYAV